jgi:hypothetical protein
MRKLIMIAMLAFTLFAAAQPGHSVRPNDPLPECDPCPWNW